MKTILRIEKPFNFNWITKGKIVQKGLVAILTTVIFTITSYAQFPQGINYQSIVRDPSGNVLANKNVTFRLNILKGSAFGSYSYVETHAAVTNQFGLVALVIGSGTPVSGTFSAINWAQGPYFLKIEIDANGGTNYSEMGTSQLISVPYAYHSKTAESAATADFNTLSNKPDLTQYVLNANTAKWDKDSTNDVLLNGDQIISGEKSFTDSTFFKSNVTTRVDTLGSAIIGENLYDIGSAIGVKGSSAAQSGYGLYGEATATSGGNYGIFGRSYSSYGYGVRGISPYIGVQGTTISTLGNGYGVYGSANNGDNYGVYGINSALSGEAIGVQGRSNSSTGIGVYGIDIYSSGENYGVYGKNQSSGGAGVKGESFYGVGVIGESTFTSGNTIGVLGKSNSTNGFGVKGENLSTSGYGVYGVSNAVGVYGVTNGNSGSAIYALANDLDGSTFGLNVTNRSSSGRAIYAAATATSGTTYGVSTNVSSPTGTAVFAANYAETGNGYAIFARSETSQGFAISANATSSTGTAKAIYAYCSSSQGYDFYAAGPGTNYGSPSSIRWKRDIRTMDNVLSKVTKLKGVYYTWDKEHGDNHDLGFIGEEVAKYFPEVVSFDPEAPGFVTGMDYSKMTPILLQAINEQQVMIENQNNAILELTKRIEALEKK